MKGSQMHVYDLNPLTRFARVSPDFRIWYAGVSPDFKCCQIVPKQPLCGRNELNIGKLSFTGKCESFRVILALMPYGVEKRIGPR